MQKQGKHNIINQEMFRNSSIQKQPTQIPFSPQSVQSSTYNQTSHLIIQPMERHSHDQAPLQKTRSFSHKKLSLTSAMPSTMGGTNVYGVSNMDGMRKLPIANGFQSSKFYRPPQQNKIHQNSNGILINHSKKISSAQESKVSLKLSVAVSQINSPQKCKQLNDTFIRKSETTIASGQLEYIKYELKQAFNSKIQHFQHEINSQGQIINSLKHKIQCLQGQLKQKTDIISTLLLKNQKQGSKQSQPINIIMTRICDIEKILSIISSQGGSAQNSINCKIDALTRSLVQMNISKENKGINNLRVLVNKNIVKMEQWLKEKQYYLRKLEENVIKKQEKYSKLNEMVQQICQKHRLMIYKIGRIQQQITNHRKQKQQNSCKITITDTKDSINYWQTFQDYNLTNRSQAQIKNVSLFAQDDYFFHPETKHMSSPACIGQMNSSICSIPSTYSSTLPHFIYQISQLNAAQNSSNSYTQANIYYQHKCRQYQMQSPTSPTTPQSRLTSFATLPPLNPIIVCSSPVKSPCINMNNSNNNNNNTNNKNNTNNNNTNNTNTHPSNENNCSNVNSTSSLQNIINLMQDLKTNYENELPLKCILDKHGRIIVSSTNRILQNSTTGMYYKINQQQMKILISRGYLNTNNSECQVQKINTNNTNKTINIVKDNNNASLNNILIQG